MQVYLSRKAAFLFAVAFLFLFLHSAYWVCTAENKFTIVYNGRMSVVLFLLTFLFMFVFYLGLKDEIAHTKIRSKSQ